MKNTKKAKRLKRHIRVRMKFSGTEKRPRLIVHRSAKNLTAQIIDDIKNITLFCLSTANKEIKAKFPYGGNVKAAGFFGEVFSRKLQEKGYKKIVFDRAGYLYHGRIKTFAESLRKSGLEF